jgi:hypothetical protein
MTTGHKIAPPRGGALAQHGPATLTRNFELCWISSDILIFNPISWENNVRHPAWLPFLALAVAGVHAITWNGTDDRGAGLPSGTYLYTIDSDAGRVSRRMVLVR